MCALYLNIFKYTLNIFKYTVVGQAAVINSRVQTGLFYVCQTSSSSHLFCVVRDREVWIHKQDVFWLQVSVGEVVVMENCQRDGILWLISFVCLIVTMANCLGNRIELFTMLIELYS